MSGRLDVLVVRTDEKTGKNWFTKIGAAFPNKDGKGYSVNLDALPTNGKLVLREPLPKREPGSDEDAF